MGQPAIEQAVILAAGRGERIQGLSASREPISKPLILLDGIPMVARVIRTLAAAGIRDFVVVTGYLSERVEAEVARLNGAGDYAIRTVFNDRWDTLANGVSALVAGPLVKGPFLLSMSDHLYDVSIPRALIRANLDWFAVRLSIDRKIDQVFDLDDATKVRTDGERIVAIGKELAPYDAVDIGLFACTRELFPELQAALAEKGDCSLSDGMRRLAARDSFGFFDIGPALWQDVDNPEMLENALSLLRRKLVLFPD